MELLKLKCVRCGHVWIPRVVDVKKCPKCSSRDWNGAYVRKVLADMRKAGERDA